MSADMKDVQTRAWANVTGHTTTNGTTRIRAQMQRRWLQHIDTTHAMSRQVRRHKWRCLRAEQHMRATDYTTMTMQPCTHKSSGMGDEAHTAMQCELDVIRHAMDAYSRLSKTRKVCNFPYDAQKMQTRRQLTRKY